MKDVVLIGCGYVADLYMRSFDVMTDMRVLGAFDRDPERRRAFCARWQLRMLPDMAAVKEAGAIGLISFLVPFVGCAAAAYYVLGWQPMPSGAADASAALRQ